LLLNPFFMIRVTILLLPIAIGIVAISSSFGQTAETEALTHLEDRHLLAMINRDRDELTSLYDDEYEGVMASGHMVDKATVIEFLMSASPHVLLSKEEVKVKVFGTVSMTTGKLLSKSKTGSIIGKSRFIHIYQKRGDRWKILQSQGTVIIHE
jgi:hypothetical protein